MRSFAMRSSSGKMTNRMVRIAQGTISWEMRRMTYSFAGMSSAAVPDSAYEMVLEAEDEGSGGMDVYHAEFAQKNGQWAFVSPIYAGL